LLPQFSLTGVETFYDTVNNPALLPCPLRPEDDL